jgi:hypothetical protein
VSVHQVGFNFKLKDHSLYKRADILSVTMHIFIQWMNLRHTDCMWIVWVCEFSKLSYLSVLISIDILRYIILYSVVFDIDVLWVWVIVIHKLYSDYDMSKGTCVTKWTE